MWIDKRRKCTKRHISLQEQLKQAIINVVVSLGSVARKNLERAVAIYNANKDEIELTRRFTTKKNSNCWKREQSHHKKLMKTETCLRTTKTKSEMKEKSAKDLKRSLQGILSNHKKSSHFTDNGKNISKNTNKTHKVELRDIKKEKNQTLKETEISPKVPDTFIKKLILKNDVKRILPKLPVRPIERKIKEKKQLTVAVLNISLPSLEQLKGETSKDSKTYNYKNMTQKTEYTDYNYNKNTYLGLEEPDEIYCSLSNRKRIVDDIKGQLYTSNKITSSKKRSYLLQLPITETNRKGLNIPPSENINLLTIQEPDKTFTLPLPINNNLCMLSQHIKKEKDFYYKAEHPPIKSDQLKNRETEGRRKKHHTLQRYKTIGTSEFGHFININGEEEPYTLKNDFTQHKSLNPKENMYNFKRNELNVF